MYPSVTGCNRESRLKGSSSLIKCVFCSSLQTNLPICSRLYGSSEVK